MTTEYSIENDYYVIYSQNLQTKIFNILLAIRAKHNKSDIHKLLKFIKTEYKIKFTLIFSNDSFSIQLHTLDYDIIQTIISDVTLLLKQAGYQQSCIYSNRQDNLSLYKINNFNVVANETAIMEYVNDTNKSNEQTINPIAGLLGGILGISTGTIVWIIAGYFGWIVGWVGYLIVRLGVRGFKLLGKGITKGWGIVLIVISIFAIIFANFASLGLGIYFTSIEEGLYLSFSKILLTIPFLIFMDSEVKSSLIMNLIISLFLGGYAMSASIRDIPTKSERSEPLSYYKID